MTVLDIADRARAMAEELGFTGEIDVRWEGSRSTSYVGQPTGSDVIITVSIREMTDADRGGAA